MHLKLLVEHKVEAKDLELVVGQSSCRRYYFVCGTECISHDLLNLAEYVRPKVNFKVWVILVEVALILAERQLVACFVSTIVVGFLLHCIVCQMYQFVS